MDDKQDLKGMLERYLQSRYPLRDQLRLTALERLTGGLSYETYFVNLEWREEDQPRSEVLVLSKEPQQGVAPPYDVRPQYEVLQHLKGLGVPVPAVQLLESDASVLGRRFFLMEKVRGENLDTYFIKHPDQLPALRRQYAEIIVKLHSLQWQSMKLTSLTPPQHEKAHAMAEIQRYEAVMLANQYNPQPLMAEIFNWLKRNVPVADRTTLCHGDLKVGVAGNFFADDGQITALLDWELVSIGDPLSDLGYVSLVLQNRLFWDKEEFLQTYETLTDTQVNRESLFFWEVMTYVKWIVMGYPGFKSGLTSGDHDVRALATNVAFLPWLKNEAAVKLGI